LKTRSADPKIHVDPISVENVQRSTPDVQY
jgi:hypothetical protein